MSNLTLCSQVMFINKKNIPSHVLENILKIGNHKSQEIISSLFMFLRKTNSPNVQLQEISIPTPQKVIGNSKGVGDFKRQTFLRKVWD